MALQNSAIVTMSAFLNGTFYIPNYQRDYSWEENELEDFWDDLDLTRPQQNKDHSNHFLGQVVVHNDDEQKRKYIIDGQQRTITSTIFMRVLQVFYEKICADSSNPDSDYKRDAEYKKSDITSLHIGRFISTRKNELHLRLGESDEDFFRESVQLGVPIRAKKEDKKSRERIRRAFYYFYDRIKAELDSLGDTESKVELLNDYYSTFTEHFVVLYMEASKLEEAFVIFETLNARGRDLETSDLLKNFIFSHSKDPDLAQKRWLNMLGSLDKADPTKYVRHFWNSNHSFAREKELYGKISKSLSTRNESDDFLIGLSSYACYYHDLTFPDDCTVFSDDCLIDSLKALRMLRASTFYPLILAMKQAKVGFPDKDIGIVARAIEIYTFRNFTICGRNSNRSEVFFTSIARDIYGGNLDTVASITAKIRNEIVGDDEFSANFDVWCGSRGTKDIVRYILGRIHSYLDKNTEVSSDNNKVHIEHIMPEDPKNWSVSDDVHTAYLWRLGNLALLNEKLNRSASNKPFQYKKKTYFGSKIEPNKAIANYDDWTALEIEDRQKVLRGYALDIWKK